MLKKMIKISFLLILYLIICNVIYYNVKKDNTNSIQQYISIKNSIPKKEISSNKEQIGKLIIKKLDINQELYEQKSSKNNVEENVTILDGSIPPTTNNSIIFLAAHSGIGKIAYFKNLDKLEQNDEIILEYQNTTYYYTVESFWETKKNGTITVSKGEKNQLVLTTCSPTKDGYQLIINCIEKESN